jgi:hypothetical protein
MTPSISTNNSIWKMSRKCATWTTNPKKRWKEVAYSSHLKNYKICQQPILIHKIYLMDRKSSLIIKVVNFYLNANNNSIFSMADIHPVKSN